MGQRSAILARILGFDGWRVEEHFFETKDGERVAPVGSFRLFRGTLLVLRVEPRWRQRCSQCGEVCPVLHEEGSAKPRRWRDLTWGDHHVVIEYATRRVKCQSCDAHCVEMVAWADPRQRTTRRLQQRIALDCSAAPLSHVAERYGMSWSAVRRAEAQAIARWERTRPPPVLTQVGVDEKYLGRRNKLDEKFVTIVSDLSTGEPMWIGMGRRIETLAAWLDTLSDDDKQRIDLFAMDMHAPFYEAIDRVPGLEHVAIVHDAFHNWETLVRRARGYRDHQYLLRKLRFMVANPLRTRAGRDVFADLDQVTQLAA